MGELFLFMSAMFSRCRWSIGLCADMLSNSTLGNPSPSLWYVPDACSPLLVTIFSASLFSTLYSGCEILSYGHDMKTDGSIHL